MKRADHHLIQQVLDGSISQQAFAGFQQRMRTEPELAKLYGEYALLNHSLCEEFEDQPIDSTPVPISRWCFPAWIAWLAAAAVLVAAVSIYRKGGVKPVPVMATVQFSPDAVWQVTGVAPDGGSPASLPIGGTLRLSQGQVSIFTSPTASALIEGPSTLTFVSPESLHLAEGRGRFRLEKSRGQLEVTTPSMAAVGTAGDFGIATRSGAPDELHVFDGTVGMRLNGASESRTLSAGQAVRIAGAVGIEPFAADTNRFQSRLSEFQTVMTAPFIKAEWRMDYGNPAISADGIDGVNYSIFRRLPQAEPSGNHPVLLATLETKIPSTGSFHTDGWAGLSFFSSGNEVLFFGDTFGRERTWALDLRKGIPVSQTGERQIVAKTVTLRYDRRTGEVSLHEGNLPLGPAFRSGTIAPETTFDEIRLGASSSAAFAVRSLTLRVGGGSQ